VTVIGRKIHKRIRVVYERRPRRGVSEIMSKKANKKKKKRREIIRDGNLWEVRVVPEKVGPTSARNSFKKGAGGGEEENVEVC